MGASKLRVKTDIERFSETSLIAHKINTLNAELNPIWHLLALLGAHHILHVIRIRVKQCHNRQTKISVSFLLLAVRQFAC